MVLRNRPGRTAQGATNVPPAKAPNAQPDADASGAGTSGVGTAAVPAPATGTTTTAPVDTDMREAVPDGQTTDTGTVAPAATTTEIRGMTHGLANLEVENPTPAPPAAATAAMAGTSAHNPTAPVVNIPQQEINVAVQAAATAAAANVRADFVDVMRQFAQVPSDSTSRRAETVNLRDLKLPEFQGSKKGASNYIEPEFYLPLLSWTREVRTLLVGSGLSQRQQALSIINALTGAARRSFFRAYTLNVDNATRDDVLDKLVALVPDHKSMFTQKALDMTFTMNTLRDDIETFGLLVQHGEMAADGSRFWYKQLVQNLLSVRSDILTLSQNFLNEHLDYRPAESFNALITRTIGIVSKLDHEGVLSQALRKRPGNSRDAPDSGDSTDGKRSKKQKGASKVVEGKRQSTKVSDAVLAQRFDRCGKCARYIADATARATHVATCTGATDRNGKDLFPTRMGQVRRLVDAGKASEVNNFTKRTPPAKAK